MTAKLSSKKVKELLALSFGDGLRGWTARLLNPCYEAWATSE
jgi:hypothetical protein